MSLLLHFSQGHLQVVHISLEGHHLILQLTFLGGQLGAHLLLVLQTFLHLLQLGLLGDFGLNQLVAAVLCIRQVVLLLNDSNKFYKIMSYNKALLLSVNENRCIELYKLSERDLIEDPTEIFVTLKLIECIFRLFGPQSTTLWYSQIGISLLLLLYEDIYFYI